MGDVSSRCRSDGDNECFKYMFRVLRVGVG